MSNIDLIKDIKSAVSIFRDMRKARRTARENEANGIMMLPKLQGASLFNTVEGTVLSYCGKDITEAACKAFKELNHEKRNQLCFSPRNGEFIDRADFWRELLSSVMTEKQLRKAMIRIIHWYIHINHLNKEGKGYAA